MHAVAQDPAPVCVCRLLKTFSFPFFFVFKARPPLRKDVNPQITHKCIMCIYSGTLLKIQHTSLTHSLADSLPLSGLQGRYNSRHESLDIYANFQNIS